MVVGVKKSTGKKVGEKIGKGKIGSKNNVGEKRVIKRKVAVKKRESKKKWGCQIGKNGGRLKYFLQKMFQKKKKAY